MTKSHRGKQSHLNSKAIIEEVVEELEVGTVPVDPITQTAVSGAFLMRHQPILLYPALRQLSMDSVKNFFNEYDYFRSSHPDVDITLRQRIMDPVWRRVKQLAPSEAEKATTDEAVKKLLLQLKGPTSKEAVLGRLQSVADKFSFVEETEKLVTYIAQIEEELEFIAEKPSVRPTDSKLIDLFKSRLSKELRNLVEIRTEKDATLLDIMLLTETAAQELESYRHAFPSAQRDKKVKSESSGKCDSSKEGNTKRHDKKGKTGGNPKGDSCTICGHKGHFAIDCWHGSSERKPKKCTSCGRMGHLVEECRSRSNGNDNREVKKCGKCGEPGHATKDCWSKSQVNAAEEAKEQPAPVQNVVPAPYPYPYYPPWPGVMPQMMPPGFANAMYQFQQPRGVNNPGNAGNFQANFIQQPMGWMPPSAQGHHFANVIQCVTPYSTPAYNPHGGLLWPR